ncbi:MAG: MBL fold metallo-hydrolase [Anaerolineae bacterium]|nr:MBL fold metallo-hydrolase [Anaerolineae bacterium]
MLKISCVVENVARRSSVLWAEHGLSFWIETSHGRLLFDTGQSGAVLLHNLDALGLDAATLDALAISHAHYDHTGGLLALTERLAPGLPLYANADLLRSRFSQRGEAYDAIGLSVDENWLRAHFTLHLDDAPQQILPGVWTTGAITARPHLQGYSARHAVYNGEQYIADPYRDDLSLVIEMSAGVLVLCGCCHAGLLNTLEHVRRTFTHPITVVAGGTHLVSADTATLTEIAQTLAAWNVCRVYLNHCSGEDAYYVLRQVLGGDRVRTCPAGTFLDLEAS